MRQVRGNGVLGAERRSFERRDVDLEGTGGSIEYFSVCSITAMPFSGGDGGGGGGALTVRGSLVHPHGGS